MTIAIDAEFDGGNIDVIDARDPGDVRLAIRPDRFSSYFQWFAFRIVGARGTACRLRIVNAGAASYEPGWRNGYRAAVSSDRETWRRAPTTYDGATLTIDLVPEADCVWVAYFALHTEEQHARFLGRIAADPLVSLAVPGRTLDGRAIDLATIGAPATGKRIAWIVGRQHAGETMASYFIEGLVERLLERHDPVAAALRDSFVFHIVPNINPDGSRRGHLRCNAAGVDLNREWAAPSMARSPEIFLIRQRMIETGVDLFLDVHGDEATPHNFLIGSMGVPNQTAAMTKLFDDYLGALVAATPDHHPHNGHWRPDTPPANLAIGSKQIANRFGCLSITIEMPFADENDTPDARDAWSPRRSRRLGRAHLDAIAAVAPRLR
jgi:murein tripeptide amidase MpaA